MATLSFKITENDLGLTVNKSKIKGIVIWNKKSCSCDKFHESWDNDRIELHCEILIKRVIQNKSNEKLSSGVFLFNEIAHPHTAAKNQTKEKIPNFCWKL